jgi:hypothetical protein
LSLSGNATAAQYQAALDSITYSSTSSSPSSAGSDSQRTITLQASSGGQSSNTVTNTIDVGQIYNLTTGVDTINAGAGNDIIKATANTLSAGDVINGGGGTNTLALTGAGTFNMTLPTSLTNIQEVTAQEGQTGYVSNGVTYTSQVQTVELRSGLDATIQVALATTNPNNPNTPTITIIGAANDSSTINLASGNDLVELGSSLETVNSGGGSNIFTVTASTIGATINGGTSGADTLEVSGGGAIAMGANMTHITEALLVASTAAYNFTANGISGLIIDDLSTATSDSLIAGGTGQTLTGGGAGKLTMNAANEANVLLKDSATIFNGDLVKNLFDGDAIDVAGLAFSQTGTSLVFAFNSTIDETTLSVSVNNVLKTAINLFGQYSASNFSAPSADSAGTGTLITLTDHLNLSSPH